MKLLWLLVLLCLSVAAAAGSPEAEQIKQYLLGTSQNSTLGEYLNVIGGSPLKVLYADTQKIAHPYIINTAVGFGLTLTVIGAVRAFAKHSVEGGSHQKLGQIMVRHAIAAGVIVVCASPARPAVETTLYGVRVAYVAGHKLFANDLEHRMEETKKGFATILANTVQAGTMVAGAKAVGSGVAKAAGRAAAGRGGTIGGKVAGGLKTVDDAATRGVVGVAGGVFGALGGNLGAMLDFLNQYQGLLGTLGLMGAMLGILVPVFVGAWALGQGRIAYMGLLGWVAMMMAILPLPGILGIAVEKAFVAPSKIAQKYEQEIGLFASASEKLAQQSAQTMNREAEQVIKQCEAEARSQNMQASSPCTNYGQDGFLQGFYSGIGKNLQTIGLRIQQALGLVVDQVAGTIVTLRSLTSAVQVGFWVLLGFITWVLSLFGFSSYRR